ncbi:MAG: ribonuclease III [Rickettsiales bacterium]|jgi:ribonuclease-3|nr:ribonuclease III [Rickettsiales bacterium]
MKKLKYVFKDGSLLDLALTQSGADAANNNERLEFLGDRVVGLSVAAMLYDMFPAETEGELARRHAVLVSTKTLARVAQSFGFDKLVRHGHMTGGKMEHISANAMESVIGALYLDGGWNAARDFVFGEWAGLAKADAEAPKDPKTELQELAQHSGAGKLPKYEFADGKKNGFVANVLALGKSASGIGGTKKAASADAAKNLLEKLGRRDKLENNE